MPEVTLNTIAKSRVRPVKRRYAHDVLLVETVGGVGFRATCDCGWKGGRCDTYAEARGELAWHRGVHEA